MSAATLTPSARATGLPSLALRLTRARLATRQGEGVLYLASMVAFALSSALALTVAGGTWMFFNRWQNPTGLHAELLAADPSFETMLTMYFMLAILACALVLPSMAGLASGAAVLGARGRDRRLAVLRLVGLSSTDVTRMSLIDTALQALVGIAVGVVGYFVTLPAWRFLTMQAMPVDPAEMLLPWWLILIVTAATFVTGIGAAWWGLRQVRISPLGVSKRAVSPALRAWRVAVFAVLLVGFGVVSQLLRLNGAVPMLIFGVVLIVVIQGFNLFAAWLLQVLARSLSHLPTATGMWAARRVQADARTTWKRVSGLGLLSLIGAYIAVMPISLNGGDDPTQQNFASGAQWDITKGAIITLGVGFALTAMSIFIAQASAILERSEQSLALANMGASARFLTRVTWWETLAPLVLAITLGAGLGFLFGMPMATTAAARGMELWTGLPIMGVVLLAGIGLAVAALAACGPLQSRVLATHERHND
ncbi:MAG: hypothetical protein QM804_06160 [Propionicimonas sp.]